MPRLRKPQRLCSSSHHLPLLLPRPLPLLLGYKHTQHMVPPGAQHSSPRPQPPGRSHRLDPTPCPATHCWSLRGDPNTQSTCFEQLPVACGSQLSSTAHPGSAHFTDGKTDPKVASRGPPALLLSRARTSQTADSAQLGQEWEGPRASRPQAAHLGDPSGQPSKELSPLPTPCLGSPRPHPQELFLVNDPPSRDSPACHGGTGKKQD